MIKKLLLLIFSLGTIPFTYAQYCTSNLYDGFSICENFAALEQFSLGVLSHQTSCSPNGYGDYTSDTIPLEKGVDYHFTVSSVSGGQVHMGMWIDNNDNYSFNDTLEFIYSSGGTPINPFYSDTLRIDSSANEGYHRLRVRVLNNDQVYDTSSCVTYFGGEVHDYIVHILPEPDCFPASDLELLSFSDTEVSFSWDGPGTNYTIEYGPEGFVRGTGMTSTISGNSTSVQGLTSNTLYDIYVRNDCSSSGNGLSAYSSPLKFRTNCTPFNSFPYFEDFEDAPWVPTIEYDTEGDTISPCWSRSPLGTSDFRWLVRTGPSPGYMTGPAGGRLDTGNYLYTHSQEGISGDTALLRLPNFDVSALTKPWLSFYYHMYGGSTGQLNVQVSPDNGTNWTTIYSISGQQQASAADPWLNYGLDLSPYSDSTISIRFAVVKDGYSGDLSIDDVSLGEGPSCTPVFNTALLSETTSSATLYWEGSGDLYEIEYEGTGFTQGTGTTEYHDNDTITLNGLSPNSCYDIYVRNACDTTNGDLSPWSAVYTFCTECNDITSLPWLESFDNWINCWDIIDNDNNNYTWGEVRNVEHAQTGNNAASSTSNVWGEGADDWIISPRISLTGNQRMKFWAKADELSTPGIMVLLSTTGSDIQDFKDTIHSSTISRPNYVEYKFSLAAYSGNVHIAIVNSSLPGLFVDELLIEDIPSCLEPDYIEMEAVADKWASASWATEGETDVSWLIQYDTADFELGSGLTLYCHGQDTAMYGLSPNVEYELYVQSICGGNDSSSWTGPVSFRTLCTPFAAPLTETFEDTSSTRSCWTQDYLLHGEPFDAWIFADGSGGFGSSISHAFDGAKNARFEPHYNGPGTGKLLSPIIDLSPLSRPFLTFFYGQEKDFAPNSNYLNVYYRDSLGKEWTLLFSDSTGKALWTRAGMDLPNPSSTYQLAFEGIDNLAFSNVLDHIEIDEVPSCPDIYNITGTNYTYTSVDLNWTAPNGTIANIWYGDPGFFRGANSITGTKIQGVSNGYTLSGLQSGKDYDLYVQNICGNDTADWAGPFSFTTLCDPAPVNTPYMQDFEEGMNCYTILNDNFDDDQWELSTMESHTGSYSAMLRTDFNSGNNDDWLITPRLHLGPDDSIIFYTRAQAFFEPDTLVLLISTDSLLTEDFSTVLWSKKLDNTTFEKVAIDLSAYADSNVYFAFRVPPSNLDGYRIFIDNLFVGDSIPAICTSPEGFDPLSISSFTCDSIRANWSTMTGLVKIEYDTAGFVPGTGTVLDSLEGSSLEIGGFQPNATYQFYLANICPNGATSEYAGPFNTSTGSGPVPGANFTYLISPSNPYEVSFDAHVSDHHPHTFEWNFGDGNAGTGSPITHTYNASIGTFSVNLTVHNNCGSDDTTITISGVDLQERNFIQEISVFPNPAEKKVTIETYSPGNMEMSITSIAGKEIYKRYYKGGKIMEEIRTEQWPRGIYLINISTAYDKTSRKLILR